VIKMLMPKRKLSESGQQSGIFWNVEHHHVQCHPPTSFCGLTVEVSGRMQAQLADGPLD